MTKDAMPDQPQIPEGVKVPEGTPTYYHEIEGVLTACVPVTRLPEQIPMVAASDAAKFAEREYERVCEERDAERAKLAQVREILQAPTSTMMTIDNLVLLLNDSDPTEVDNG